jgi:UDP-N-acetylglucosamine--N-acetylmuramyl-(pentapeptide) pyrophosphoryl-undecaprenol N-acetylglucosamine transferase
MRILIAAGGSGGHLFPAQQLAELLPDAEIHFAGHGLEKSPFFHKSLYAFTDIESASLEKPFAFLRTLCSGVVQSLRLLRSFSPDVVVGFGSYHTVPLLCAAVLLRKPIVLYEANASLGKVNRLFAPFAKSIASPFPGVGVRVPFFPWIQKEAVLSSEGYGLEAPVCLVFGGSQGASFLNEHFWRTAKLAGVQVLHFTGKEEEVARVEQRYAEAGVKAHVKAFETQMARAYAAANCAVCRAGAGTVSELVRYQLPALLIPYPHAGGHQQKNAEWFAQVGGGSWLRQTEAQPERCAERIAELLCSDRAPQLPLGFTTPFEVVVKSAVEG